MDVNQILCQDMNNTALAESGVNTTKKPTETLLRNSDDKQGTKKGKDYFLVLRNYCLSKCVLEKSKG